jgi:hypothetical protein
MIRWGGEIIMATLIIHDHLKEIVTAGEIVIGCDPTAVEGIKLNERMTSRL